MPRRAPKGPVAPPPTSEPEEKTAAPPEGQAEDTGEGGLLPDDDLPEAEINDKAELPSPADGAVAAPKLGIADEPPGFGLNFTQAPDMGGSGPERTAPPPNDDDRRRMGELDGDDDDSDPTHPPRQPRRDGEPGREVPAAFGEFESDVVVDLRVQFEDKGTHQLESCGMLYKIPLSEARRPWKFIPAYDGVFWLDVFNPDTGRKLGNYYRHRSTGSEFPKGWRVGMDINEEIKKGVNQVLQQMGLAPMAAFPVAPGAPGTVPMQAFSQQSNYFQGALDKVNQQLADEREARIKAEAERRVEAVETRLQAELRDLRNQIANGGGMNGMKDLLSPLLTAALAPKQNDLLEYIRFTKGPEARSIEAAIFTSLIETMAKVKKAGEGGDDFTFKGVVSALQEFQKNQADEKKKEREFWEKKEADKKAAETEKKAEAAKNAEGGKRKSRAINAFLEGIVSAIGKRENPSDVSQKVSVMMAAVEINKWYEFDESTKEMRTKLKADPEAVFVEFATFAGWKPPVSDDDSVYLLTCAAHFRHQAGMPMRQPPKPPEAPPAAAVAPPAPAAEKKPEPEPSKGN